MIAIITTTVIHLSNTKKEEPIVKENTLEKKQKEETNEEYKVDIKGQVNNPGIYTLTKDKRVIDVIEQAGGLTENANTDVINLSKKITDEMVIIIYSNYEIEHFKATKELENYLINSCESNSNGVHNDACITSEKQETNGMISLNNATKEELMSLTGIGEAKAEDIIEYRTKNGGFKNIEEIKNIKGIGESLFDKIKDRITL